MIKTAIQTTLALLLAASATTAATPAPPRNEGRIPKLPQAISSFGAAATESGKLYIYGGHIGEAHDHSADNLAKDFVTLDLQRPAAWQTLPMRQPLQGLALVAHRERILRIGGVEARNAADKESDMHSTPTVEFFDPANGQWTEQTPLPAPRSSHDAVVVGDKAYVIGGWALAGKNDTAQWSSDALQADLTATPIRWEPLPKPPFTVRAAAVAATTRSIYVIGGLQPDGKITAAVWRYDLTEKNWNAAPAFPGTGRHGSFGVGALGHGDTIWASGADGQVFSLDDRSSEWRNSGHKLKSPRFFHRLIASPRAALLFIGGAGKSEHLDDTETVEWSFLEAPALNTQPSEAPARLPGTGQTNWPGFRGDGTSHTTAANLPLKWSDENGVAWSVALPGKGQSSPIIWNGHAYITAVEGSQKETLVVQCRALADGDEKWTVRLPASSTQADSDYVSRAAPTPIADERGVYAFFESGDLLAFDHQGTKLWQRTFGPERGGLKGNHGLGSSPVQDAASLYLSIEHDGPSSLIAINKTDGSIRWETSAEPKAAWSTPLLHADTLIHSSSGHVRAYAATTGKVSWTFDGLKQNNVPSPTPLRDGFLIAGTERGDCIFLRPGQETASLGWRAEEATSSFGSPLVTKNAAFFVSKAGVLFARDTATGAALWSRRLPASCWASPVAAGEVAFFFTQSGTTVVLRPVAGGEPEIHAENKLTVTGRVYGVAASDNRWLLRTDSQLICIGGSVTP